MVCVIVVVFGRVLHVHRVAEVATCGTGHIINGRLRELILEAFDGIIPT